jgi:hypothetical protein
MLKTQREHNQEDLWDFICCNIGFDEKGKEIQDAIRLYVKQAKIEAIKEALGSMINKLRLRKLNNKSNF